MTRTRLRSLVAVVMVTLLVSAAIAPAAAASTGPPDDCKNADKGPGEDGPPGFVGGLVPDFIGDLVGSLPVPNFVKSFFGASTC